MKSASIVLVVLASLFASAGAMADDLDEQSRAYFETGAKAYEKGDYPNAIRAFDQAYNLTKRPGLIFSIAQSYKRQYAVDGKAYNLRKAIEHYRRFLAEDKSGKRRGDASAAILECEALLLRLPPEEPATATAVAEPPQPTQIAISTQVEEATISIDGGEPHSLEPVEVKPGKHKVVIRAPGYFPEEREIYANQSQMTAIDVPLRAMPAKVAIDGRPGSAVTVDGMPMGTLPLLAPLEVDAGERSITVSQNGFVSHTRDYSLARGSETTIKTDLHRTRQRIGSFVLFGTGVVIAGTGVLMAMGSAGAYAQGSQIKKRRDSGSITAEELVEYNGFRDQQDQLLVASTVTVNLGAAVGALGFLLYYFDEPAVAKPRPKKDDKAPKKEQSPGMRDLALIPSAGPGFVGLSFGANF